MTKMTPEGKGKERWEQSQRPKHLMGTEPSLPGIRDRGASEEVAEPEYVGGITFGRPEESFWLLPGVLEGSLRGSFLEDDGCLSSDSRRLSLLPLLSSLPLFSSLRLLSSLWSLPPRDLRFLPFP